MSYYKDAVNGLIEKVNSGEISLPHEGDYCITDYCVCESGAGFYVGYWCVERMDDGKLLPQPYSRCSSYFNTEEEAYEWLKELNSL